MLSRGQSTSLIIQSAAVAQILVRRPVSGLVEVDSLQNKIIQKGCLSAFSAEPPADLVEAAQTIYVNICRVVCYLSPTTLSSSTPNVSQVAVRSFPSSNTPRSPDDPEGMHTNERSTSASNVMHTDTTMIACGKTETVFAYTNPYNAGVRICALSAHARQPQPTAQMEKYVRENLQDAERAIEFTDLAAVLGVASVNI